jgi:hypothetical protein
MRNTFTTVVAGIFCKRIDLLDFSERNTATIAVVSSPYVMANQLLTISGP